MSKDTFYFSHDTNAFLDPKIRIVISEYGIISYAMFWIIVEMLSTQKEFKIPIEGFIKSLKPLLQGKHLEYSEDGTPQGDGYYDDENNRIEDILVGCHRIELAYATSLFNKMIDIGLFKTDGKYFWSDSLNERMNLRNEKSQKQRDNANKRWHPKATLDNNNANAMPENNNGNTTNNATQCLKGKERKGKENKLNNIYIEYFKNFWTIYPKKIGKSTAERVFIKLAPDETLFTTIIDAVKKQTEWEQWKTDNGKYIPNASTWLNQRRWEDETPQIKNNGHKPESQPVKKYRELSDLPD